MPTDPNPSSGRLSGRARSGHLATSPSKFCCAPTPDSNSSGPAMSFTGFSYKSSGPLLVETNASRLPSGDQTAAASIAESTVNRLTTGRLISWIQTSKLPRIVRLTTSCWPSGASSGSSRFPPSGGPNVVNWRPVRSTHTSWRRSDGARCASTPVIDTEKPALRPNKSDAIGSAMTIASPTVSARQIQLPRKEHPLPRDEQIARRRIRGRRLGGDQPLRLNAVE